MPLPILAVAALASAGSSAFQFINGIKQSRQAAKINPVRPQYQIPDAVNQATGVAQNMANSAMPGFGQNLAKLGANTASTVRAAQESGSANNALAVIAAAGDSQNNATNNLYTQNAQFQRQGAQALISQLGTKAQYEDKAWDYNQRKPYEEAAAAKAALTQAGATNTMNGLAGLGSAATQAARGAMPGAGGLPTGPVEELAAKGPSQLDSGLGGFKLPALNFR